MSDVLNNDDMHALAAEYVLGTLEADERVRAHAMLDVDHGFRAMVRIWERRFSELHLMVEPVDPPPQIWDRIKAQLPAITPPPSEPGATRRRGVGQPGERGNAGRGGGNAGRGGGAGRRAARGRRSAAHGGGDAGSCSRDGGGAGARRVDL
jgi:hypothetical protein